MHPPLLTTLRPHVLVRDASSPVSDHLSAQAPKIFPTAGNIKLKFLFQVLKAIIDQTLALECNRFS